MAAFAQPPSYAIDGTTGAPLGGIGCGAIKFCAHLGSFAGTWRTPAELDNYGALANTRFQFYSKNGSTVVDSGLLLSVQSAGRSDDDAVYPVEFANFGTINGVSLKLTAFSPVNLSAVDLMCYPYAFFQIQVANTSSASVDAAVAFQASISGTPASVAGKGIRNDDGNFMRAVYAASDDQTAIISTGTSTDNGFPITGQCNTAVSGATNKVAVKVTLAAGQTKLIKFVYAWYNNVTGAEGIHDGMFYYLNTFSSAGAVADTGLTHFDQLRDNALSIVNRMRASNIPDWIKNQALVSLSNLTNNSLYRKDGRYAHTEGEWSTNGTMDQMFHARQIYSMLVPSLNWQELQYWARTQKTSPAGQIHHDIDSCGDVSGCPSSIGRNMVYMCPWDAQQHEDYRNIDKWVDLNCAFIISVYETFIATADTAKLSYLWPFVKKAGQRIMDQLTAYNDAADGFPYLYSGSQNSYDADGTLDLNFYNSSLAAVTYKILSKLAVIKQDAANKLQYDKYYDSTRTEFAAKYFTALKFPVNLRAEAVLTGQWLSYFLRLGEMFDTSGINFTIRSLNANYNPLTNGLSSSATAIYTEWAEYKVAHYGGLCLQTGRDSVWKALQYDWYQRIFNNRELVYDIPLDIPAKVTTPTYLATVPNGLDGRKQYISVPVVWRNYYTMVGYQRNKYSGELWLEPILPAEMNHAMTKALVFSPEGWATVNYTESGVGYATQVISFVPDSSLVVNVLYVRDKGLAVNYVKINGVPVDNAQVTKVGTGYAKELRINLQQTIPPSGAIITVSDNPNFAPVLNEKRPVFQHSPVFSSTLKSFSITTCPSVTHEISVVGLNGKTARRFSGNGVTRYRFGVVSQNADNVLSPGVYVVKVVSGNTVLCRRFILAQ